MMVHVAAHRISNKKHYETAVRTNIELMEVRRKTALAYYYRMIKPFKENKQPKVKKVKNEVNVRTLCIENKKGCLFFE